MPIIKAFSLSIILLSISIITGPMIFPSNNNLSSNPTSFHDTSLNELLGTNSPDLFYISVVNGTFSGFSSKTISIEPRSNLANGYSKVVIAKFVNTTDAFSPDDTRLDTNVWYFVGYGGPTHDKLLKYNIGIDNSILTQLNTSLTDAAKNLISYSPTENLTTISSLNDSIGTNGLEIMLFYRSGVALQVQVVGQDLVMTTFQLTIMRINNNDYAYGFEPNNQIITYGKLDGNPFNDFSNLINNIITGLPSNN